VARRRRPVVYSLRWPSALFRLLELGGGGRERIWELSWVGNNNEREREREGEDSAAASVEWIITHQRREKSSQEQGGTEGENG
jgi:hypothetical protein